MFEKLGNKLKSIFTKKATDSPFSPAFDYDPEWYMERVFALRLQLYYLLTCKYKCCTLSYQEMVYGDLYPIVHNTKIHLFTATSPKTFEMVYHCHGNFFKMMMDKKDRESLLIAKAKIELIIEKITRLLYELNKNGYQLPPNLSRYRVDLSKSFWFDGSTRVET
jgi:hypothetical protein